MNVQKKATLALPQKAQESSKLYQEGQGLHVYRQKTFCNAVSYLRFTGRKAAPTESKAGTTKGVLCVQFLI